MSERIVHKYISTACLHDLHDDCRRQCKFCEGRCLCWCHEHPRATAVDDTSEPDPAPIPIVDEVTEVFRVPDDFTVPEDEETIEVDLPTEEER